MHFEEQIMNLPYHHPDLTPTVEGHFENDQYVFFWNGPFSNWYYAPFKMMTEYGEMEFGCSEQAMMFHKAKMFNDERIAEMIMRSPSPREQKALGRKVEGYSDDIWHGSSVQIVTEILIAKFSADDALKAILLDTGDKTIVEASPLDFVWGIGMGVNDDNILNEDKWNGTNFLGIALMNARDELRNEA